MILVIVLHSGFREGFSSQFFVILGCMVVLKMKPKVTQQGCQQGSSQPITVLCFSLFYYHCLSYVRLIYRCSFLNLIQNCSIDVGHSENVIM